MTPLADIDAEAGRLLLGAREQGTSLRLLGGLAIRRQVGSALPASLGRASDDIDFVTSRGLGRDVSGLLLAAGYAPDEEFNTIQGHRRLLFYDDGNGRKVDVFVGSFEMCHRIPVCDRLDLDPDTLPLAELLLTKLQVVELNEKDLTDILALLVAKPVTADDAGINGSYIARLLANDWGLWRTTRANLARVRESVAAYNLDEVEERRVREACDALEKAADAEPKGRAWVWRNRIGDRKKWYQEPEEVG